MELLLGLERGIERLREVKWPWRALLLTVVAFLLLSVDFSRLAPSATSVPWVVVRIVSALLLTALAVSALPRSQGPGFRLAGALFAVVYGSMYLLPATETIYVSSVLPLSKAVYMVVAGALIAGVFSLLASALFAPALSTAVRPSGGRLIMGKGEWAEKLLSLAVIWTFLFMLVGALVYGPMARALDPSGYSTEQASVTNAGLALLSQPIWGIAWALLSVPLIRSLKLSGPQTALTLALYLGTLMGVDMLLAFGSMSMGLQIAHLTESVVESFVFGAATVWILQLRGRLVPATGGGLPASARPPRGVVP